MPEPWNKGKEWKEIQGENHWNWKGGVTAIRQKRDHKHGQWRIAVFERDDYRCLDCGERGIYLEANHIYSWKEYPRLRYELDNGETLCRACHRVKTNSQMRVDKKLIYTY